MSQIPNGSPPEIAENRAEAAELEIREKQKLFDYDTKEYSIAYFIEKYQQGLENDTNQIYTPKYLRHLRWTEEHQSSFIESILLGLAILPIILAKQASEERTNDKYRLAIIDGTQRVRTINQFLQNNLVLSELKYLQNLNGFKFGDLTLYRQRKFANASIRTLVLSEGADDSIIRDLFYRFNVGSGVLDTKEDIHMFAIGNRIVTQSDWSLP